MFNICILGQLSAKLKNQNDPGCISEYDSEAMKDRLFKSNIKPTCPSTNE